MPKRTPRRRRHSVGGSLARSPEPEAEPEAEFDTPLAAVDVGAELAEVRANQAASTAALDTLLEQVASLVSAVAADLISVVKSNKYALRGVLDFFWGVIFYMRTCTVP